MRESGAQTACRWGWDADFCKKLEKVGFAGQTLNRAMELLERTNVSMVSKILVKMVTKRGLTPSMALYEAEKGLREAEEKLGFSSED